MSNENYIPGFRLQVSNASNISSVFSDALISDVMIVATDGVARQAILAGFACRGLDPVKAVLRIESPDHSNNSSVSVNGAIYADSFNIVGGGNLVGATLSECVVPYSSVKGAPWSLTPNGDASLVGGKIGVGTSTPAYTLDIVGTVRASGGFTAFSDARYKTDIEVISSALERVVGMTGYTYRMKDDARKRVGVLAQDVIKQMPELVHGDETIGLSVAYGDMGGLLVEAIKELHSRVTKLERLVEKRV